MTTTDLERNTLAVALFLAALTSGGTASAHGQASNARSKKGEYGVGAGALALHQTVHVADAEASDWTFGGGLELYAGSRLADRYRTGAEFGLGITAPPSSFSLRDTNLEGVVTVLGTALWMNQIEIGQGFAFKLGIGPGLGHLFESSGALSERTAFGIAEQFGIAYEFDHEEHVRAQITVSSLLMQTFTGSDVPDAIDRMPFAGLVLSIGFRNGTPQDHETKQAEKAAAEKAEKAAAEKAAAEEAAAAKKPAPEKPAPEKLAPEAPQGPPTKPAVKP